MKLSILFLLRRNSINAKGICPIECRITLDKQRKPFATGLFINPDNWNASKQKAHPPNIDNTQINTQLSLIKQEINQAFLLLQIQNKDFDVDDIYRQYKGENIKQDQTIMKMFSLHIAKQEKLIGISITAVSVAKFHQTRNHVKTFVKHKFNKSDFLLREMTMAFITEFEYYLKAEKKFKQNTIHKTLQRFKQIVKQAVGLDFLEKDPFLLHRNKKPTKQVIFLSTEELAALEHYNFASKRLQQVADLFIFCCYTGLAYKEMANFEKTDVFTGFDGRKWISVFRIKTQKIYEIPLLHKAEMILGKYDSGENALPKISNQRFNSFLKEIGAIVGIEKTLTHHLARKTFASTILLYNDVPMEVVSELLGHSEMQTTQNHYAKVVNRKVSEQMQKVQSVLNDRKFSKG
ncbi:site-specific integrase [Chryseobacterium sp. HSC-36S06]|uniref:site-specific integrase n=1 Tax=Chryseobacterium sp. HSC-36S06 TaxID=2910970 RepID=UPI0026464D45|nr:site-specific integrase [Chryseobacterium sp. HSC-36S06]MCP2037336.1 site-specific recombinase XerD [Chryseobacterium sp. HSC-36S06]